MRGRYAQYGQTTMKHILLLIFTSLTVLICHGQKEYLRPAMEFSQNQGGSLNEYYNNVFPLLYKGFADKPYARYTAMPSFSREYAFSVEQRNESYVIVSNQLSENYWYAKNRQHVKVTTSLTEIDKGLYTAIGRLFELLTSQIQEPEDKLAGGTDGISYYFSTVDSSGRLKTGKAWSPNKKSLFADLVTICNNLFSIGRASISSETKIQAEIEKLIEELKK
jgi:hypothetical protein